MKRGIAALVALALTGCGNAPTGGLFSKEDGAPLAAPSEEPDAVAPRGAGGAPGAGGASLAAPSAGGSTEAPDAGPTGAGGQRIVVVGWVDAGSGGATTGNGGAASGSGGAPGAGGVVAGAGGTPVCSKATHCTYPRVEDGCPCDNACPMACAAFTTIERHTGAQGVIGELLSCSGPCVTNAAKDCCVLADPCGGCPQGYTCQLNQGLGYYVCVG